MSGGRLKVRIIVATLAVFIGQILCACGDGEPVDVQVINIQEQASEESEEIFEEQVFEESEETLSEQVSEETEEFQQQVDVITEPAFEEYDITLMALGDNLMHSGITRTGLQEDGTYDYTFLFERISPFLDKADIKIINQETILGGNHLGFSGFPYFNSPTEVGDAIAEAGFNVVLHASNHAADKGLEGMLNCITFWEQYPQVVMTGIHEQQADTHDIPLLTIRDVTFALLNYTYSPNMEVLPEYVQGRLDMLCNWDKATGRLDFTTLHPQVIADIEAAQELADVVIVFPHWGTEYTTVPSKYQEKFAKQMTEAGADLIIGTHPHVIQPVEWVRSENGNHALCFYSLGNYVSTQKQGICMLEAMAWVTFRVKEDDVVIMAKDTGAIPMVCHYTSNPVRLESVYLLEEYTAEQAQSHGIYGYGGVTLTLEELQKWSKDVLGEWRIKGIVVGGFEK